MDYLIEIDINRAERWARISNRAEMDTARKDRAVHGPDLTREGVEIAEHQLGITAIDRSLRVERPWQRDPGLALRWANALTGHSERAMWRWTV